LPSSSEPHPGPPAQLTDAVTSLLRRVTWIAGIALLAVMASVAILLVTWSRNEEATSRNRETLRLAREIQGLATDRETGIRGYLLTRRPESLEPEFRARLPLAAKLDSLVLETSGDSLERQRAITLRRDVQRWNDDYALRAADSASARLAALPVLAGKRLFDQIRADYATFIAGENATYVAQLQRSRLAIRIGFTVVLLELLVITAAFFWLRRRLLTQSAVLELQGKELAAQARRLEQHTVELREQTAQLQEQALELELQTTEAQAMSEELEDTNQLLGGALKDAQEARQAAESAAVEREEALNLFDVVLSRASIGFALLDSELRYVRINEALAGMNGRPVADHIGRRVFDIAPPSLVPVLEKILGQVLENGEPVSGIEMSAPVPEDSSRQRYGVANFYPIGPEGSRPTIIGVLIEETTARKELEQQLAQSQKMEAIGRLAGGVAHDFNNLLTVIKSYSTILLEALEGDPRSDDVKEIASSADRAAALTRQLLAFSRRQMLQPRPIQLNGVVREIEKLLRRLIGEDVLLQTLLEDDLWTVHADPGQIEQVVMNLAVNARDAMPAGGRLTIQTANGTVPALAGERWLEAGTYVTLSVSDTGVGMTPEVRAHLFEPFFTTKERGKGTGLGLSTVYGIVKQSGGDIAVTAEPGRGATFTIYLPKLNDGNGARPVLAAKAHVVPRGTETILLVEDDPALRSLAERILRSYGYTVLVASTGPRALSLVTERSEPIDLIATDVVMPDMSGNALVEEVHGVRPGIPVLFMSGYTDDEVVRRGLRDGRAAFLQKPFTPEQLAFKVRQVLDH
jgi:signal transduction histidine kinase/CheY-like chemotaxis protein/CHASE3 domain sensor protein